MKANVGESLVQCPVCYCLLADDVAFRMHMSWHESLIRAKGK